MDLRTVNGQLKPGAAFRLIATGYLFGAGALFIPLFAVITIVMVVGGAPMKVNGENVHGSARLLAQLAPVLMVPIILAMQSVMIGGLIVFGLWLYQKRRPIRVIAEEA